MPAADRACDMFPGKFAAPKLRSLACLGSGKLRQLKGNAFSGAAAALAKLLPQLQLLTSLEVSGNMCQDAGLGYVSSLQHLQQLRLHQPKATMSHSASRIYPSRLPTSLTHLEFGKCTHSAVAQPGRPLHSGLST